MKQYLKYQFYWQREGIIMSEMPLPRNIFFMYRVYLWLPFQYEKTKLFIFSILFLTTVGCFSQTDTSSINRVSNPRINPQIGFDGYKDSSVLKDLHKGRKAVKVLGFHGFLFGQLRYNYSIMGGVFEYENWTELRQVDKELMIIGYYPQSETVKSKTEQEIYLSDMIYAGVSPWEIVDTVTSVRHYTSVAVRPHGKYIEWHSNGKIKIKGHYRHGLKEKKWRYFNQDGKLTEVIFWQYNEIVKIISKQ